MKTPRYTLIRPRLLSLSLLATVAMTVSARAASDTWTGTTDATWATLTNWLGGSAPGTGDTATFNSAGNGNTTIDLGSGVTLGALLFDTSSAAAYTIGSGGAGSQTLTLSTVGNAITMNSTVANNELINANLALATTGTYTVTNNSTTNLLTLAGGISASTTGTKILSVTGAGNTAISGAITAGSGVMNLLKTGTGSLTLSGGGVIGASSIGGYGNTTFATVFHGGATTISSGAYTSAGEVVVGGVQTNGSAGVNTSLTVNGGSLSTATWLSVARGNGTGAVSSDLVLNNNAQVSSSQGFSVGFNSGSALNTPKGTVTLNGTSSLTIATSVNIGESANSNASLTLNGTSTFRQTNNAGETRVGGADGATGLITVNGGTASFERDLILGFTGTASGSLVLNSGTVNVASGTERWLIMNRDGAGSSSIVVDGGTLNLNTNTDIRMHTLSNAAGSSTVTLNSGAITGYVGNQTGGFSGASVVDLQYQTGASSTSTFNLNGGALTIGQVITSNNSNTSTFNFNGGTLKAAAASTTFFDLGGANQRANVRNGGAKIDTNGNNVTVGQALLHSNIGGDNAIDGGLIKSGTGTLTLGGVNTYTGATTINGGTLALGAAGSINNTSGVSLGTSGTFDVSAKVGGYTVNNLSGSGTVTGALTVSTQLAIGNSPGTVNFSSDLTLGSGSTYLYEMVGGGTSADLGDVAGALTLTGSILDLVQLGTFTEGDKFTLFAYDGALTGTFSGLADGATFTDGGGEWMIDYNDTTAGLNGGTGTSYVTITAVPEPGAALLGGLGLLGLLRRRRVA